MRIFIDVDTRDVSAIAGSRQAISSFGFKRGLLAILEVQFTQNGVVIELEGGTTLRYEIKLDGKFDSAPLAGASSAVKSGSGETTVYKFVFSTITVALDALFFVDGNVDNDEDVLELMSAVYWSTTFGDAESKTLRPTRLENNVVRLGDVVPATTEYVYDDTDPDNPTVMLGDDSQALVYDGG